MSYQKLIEFYSKDPRRMKKGAGSIAKQFKLTRAEVHRARHEVREKALNSENIVDTALALGGYTQNEQRTSYDFVNSVIKVENYFSKTPSSVEELAKENNIDLNEWECTHFWQIKKGEHMNISAHFRKRKADLVVQKNELLKELSEITSPKWKVTKYPNCVTKEDGSICPIKDKLLEIAAFDLHLGKLAWKEESGEDYDIDIATEVYRGAVKHFISVVDMNQVGRILYPIGNDMLNVDTKNNTTTAGTPQTSDSRFGKMVRVLKHLLIETINNLAMYAPVDVVVVPGNHDEQTMFMIGEILDAYYVGSERVTVNNEPTQRKYYKFGKNMIMFTHGNQEKHMELGLIAATEAPELWAATKYREVHTGHYHKTKSTSYVNIDEFQGFKVRIMPSLSGTDNWHKSKGYSSVKGAEALLWDSEKGLIANYHYNL